MGARPNDRNWRHDGVTGVREQSLSGFNEGLASLLGFPVDAVTGGINGLTYASNSLFGTEVAPITEPFGGSGSFRRALAPTITEDAPQSAPQRYVRSIGHEVGASAVPTAGMAAASARVAPVLAGGLASAVGSGAGAQTAREIAPGNAWAEMAGGLVGGSIPVAAATRMPGLFDGQIAPKNPLIHGPEASNTLASKSATVYTYPTKSEVGDALGRQHSGGLDPEGRPLVARYVVGGAPERTVEQSLPSEAIAELVQATTGKGIMRVPASELRRGAVGGVRFDRVTNRPIDVRILRSLDAKSFDGVSRHEAGHILDEIPGQIDTKGLSKELESIFNYGYEGRERTRNLTRPKDLGYPQSEARGEFMAEAIRQYMGAPDTMKARFPKTAARIRAAVNSHPELSKLIQFNSVALPVGFALSNATDNDPDGRNRLLSYLASVH